MQSLTLNIEEANNEDDTTNKTINERGRDEALSINFARKENKTCDTVFATLRKFSDAFERSYPTVIILYCVDAVDFVTLMRVNWIVCRIFIIIVDSRCV